MLWWVESTLLVGTLNFMPIEIETNVEPILLLTMNSTPTELERNIVMEINLDDE